MTGEHPLNRSWSLYYDGGSKKAGPVPKNRGLWKAYTKICSFSTVEDFWRIFNNIVDVSILTGKKDFFLFENGVQPDWDDNVNANGGLWMAHLSDCLPLPAEETKEWAAAAPVTIDTIWRDTVYHVIGEQLTDATLVVGVALNIRKNGSRVALWTRHGSQESITRVGSEWKALLNIPGGKTIGFSKHEDSKRANSSGNFFWSSFKGDTRV